MPLNNVQRAEDEAAQVYAEIFESFSAENNAAEKQSKTFVRGETIVNNTVFNSAPQEKEYRLEAKGSTYYSKSSRTDTIHEESKPEKKDKKRLLAELGEELAKYVFSFCTDNHLEVKKEMLARNIAQQLLKIPFMILKSNLH